MARIPPRTLWHRASRLLPAINWELHVLQSGLDRFATTRPWIGVPVVGLTLIVVWAAYWAVLPAILAVCLVARVVHPIETYLRSPS